MIDFEGVTYAMSKSAPGGVYELVIGFETLDALHAAHSAIVRAEPRKAKMCRVLDCIRPAGVDGRCVMHLSLQPHESACVRGGINCLLPNDHRGECGLDYERCGAPGCENVVFANSRCEVHCE